MNGLIGRYALGLALAGLLVSCGGDAPTAVEAALEGASPTAGSATTSAPPEEGPGDTSAKKGEGDDGPRDKGGGGSPGPTASEDGGGPSAAGSDDGGSPEGGDSKGGSSPASADGDSEERGGGSVAPAAGRYVYSQSGYEEFCTATCDKRKLPRRQAIDLSVARRAGDSATVVSEARSSNGGMTRSTTRYTKRSAGITRVYVRFTYSGYTFDETYVPRPAVETLRFPLASGASWKGSWEGKVSGSYSVRVEGKELVGVGKREVLATKVSSTTTFRGDFSGRANTSVWIDPQTRAVVRTAGNARMKSSYGSYGTAFATSLESGPGY